jgi:hypothetical protein
LSTGRHGHATVTHTAELQRIRQQPWFKKALLIERRLIRKFTIPWLGGSSHDTKRIYIDPRFRGEFWYHRERLDVQRIIPCVIEHEVVEAILLVFGKTENRRAYEYDGAHEIATAAEEEVARRVFGKLGLRFDNIEYEEIFKPFVTITEHSAWGNFPPDLNLEPYEQDDPNLYRDIERAMLRQNLVKA